MQLFVLQMFAEDIFYQGNATKKSIFNVVV